MRRAMTGLMILAMTVGGVSPTFGAVGDVTTVATFDADAFELPEGVTIDKRGHIYVTMPFLAEGNVRRVDLDGTDHPVADLPTGGGFGPLGLTVDGPGNLYVGVVTTDPATQGVYRVTPDGASQRLPGSGAIAFANDVTFGDRGTLYVADSTGNIWRIPNGGATELWLAHDLLEGNGSAGFGFPVGANGIAYRHRTVYVTNTEQGSIVAVPVRSDGSAGTPTIVAQSAALGGADGVELDVLGNLYVNVIARSEIVRVAPDGSSIDTVADGDDGFDFPSTSAFGTGGGERTTLYTVNFSIGPLFGGTRTWGPALLAIDTGAVGLPQP